MVRKDPDGLAIKLAFMPVDYNPKAMKLGGLSYGCGVKYFSQDGVIKLAPAAGLCWTRISPAEKLQVVQNLLESGHEVPGKSLRYRRLFGLCYWGYMTFMTSSTSSLGRVTSEWDLMLESPRSVECGLSGTLNIAFHHP